MNHSAVAQEEGAPCGDLGLIGGEPPAETLLARSTGHGAQAKADARGQPGRVGSPPKEGC